MVRINGVDTAFREADLAALAGLELDALVVPKASPMAIEAMGDEGPPVIAIVETAQGLRLAHEIASRPRVAALALGAADLGAELRLEPRPDGQEILFARSKLVVDSAAASVRAPFDVVHLDTRDDAGLEAEALLARSLGLGGKMCIHPAQVRIVNRAFAPSAGQVEWARAAIAAYRDGIREGRGAVSLDGELVDLPVVERARTILAIAERTPPLKGPDVSGPDAKETE
jgi:citrate lyase beta subunit